MRRKILSLQCEQRYQQQQRKQRRQEFFQRKMRIKESCKSIVWQCKVVQLSLLFVLVIATTTINITSGAKLLPPPPVTIPLMQTTIIKTVNIPATAAAATATLNISIATTVTPPLSPSTPAPAPLPTPSSSSPFIDNNLSYSAESLNVDNNFNLINDNNKFDGTSTGTGTVTDTECLEKNDPMCKNDNPPRKPTLIGLSSLEKEVVERLIKDWSPVVWLAPEEKFMPLGVEEFLNHVHSIDKDRSLIQGMPIGDQSEKAYLVTNVEVDELLRNENSFIYGRNPNEAPVPIYAVVTLCNRTRPTTIIKSQTTIKSNIALSSTRGPYIPLSLDIVEENNRKIRRSSRLYPTFKRIQRRSINDSFQTSEFIKNNSELNSMIFESELVLGEQQQQQQQQQNIQQLHHQNSETNLKDFSTLTTSSAEDNSMGGLTVNEFIANLAHNVKFSTEDHNHHHQTNNIGGNGEDENIKKTSIKWDLRQDVPSFHVTYWMFYPYSQGKTMCTLSLGPLGHIPFPAVYGFCLGKRKDIGSHIGDWEHMSLYFNGAAEPESLYVSAHDAGAYYTFNRLTGSFEFKKQETRKGILQRPNFPKTVTTFNNHPVLFAAKGSHGLWTAPGKHRFVKVARLYDINGFGTLWNTWKSIQIAYENMKSYGRSFVPSWFAFKGKWGNPKSKCHPFRRIGLNFCEYTDGPTGIPLKESHFQCGATYQ